MFGTRNTTATYIDATRASATFERLFVVLPDGTTAELIRESITVERVSVQVVQETVQEPYIEILEPRTIDPLAEVLGLPSLYLGEGADNPLTELADLLGYGNVSPASSALFLAGV